MDSYETPIESLAKRIGDWYRAGDIGGCDVKNCTHEATKFAETRKGRAVDTWYFCSEHFREYLHLADEIREKERKQ